MSPLRWNATVVDSPGSEPYTIVGDFVLAVRTPRSRDFVTVEIAPRTSVDARTEGNGGVALTPRPTPVLDAQWQGEVHVGAPVGIRIGNASYRLTLARLADVDTGPWVACDFCLERD